MWCKSDRKLTLSKTWENKTSVGCLGGFADLHSIAVRIHCEMNIVTPPVCFCIIPWLLVAREGHDTVLAWISPGRLVDERFWNECI